MRFTLRKDQRAQKNLFMQNKPNLLNAQMNITTAITMDYVNIRLRSRFKNKAKQTQFKPNLPDAQMSVYSILTKVYERNDIFAVPQNKANSNPIKPNFKPASQSDFNKIINSQLSIINEMPPPNVESIICYLLFVIVLGSFPSSIAVILFIRLWCLPPLNSVLSQTSTIFRISTSPISSPETQSTFASLWSREI